MRYGSQRTHDSDVSQRGDAMYTFLLGIQYVGIVVLLVTMLRVLKQQPSKQQQIMMFLLMSLLLNFVSYLF